MYKNTQKQINIICINGWVLGFNKFIIDTNVLKSNANLIKNFIGKNTMLCGVVKANAYGHGSIIVANRLKDICDFFAVANVIEAMELRDRNITNNILILGIVPMTDIKYCIFNNISVTISSLSQLYDILSVIKQLNLESTNILKVHIKINTGLNRLGVNKINDFKKMLKVISQNENIVLEGVFTHFATKGDDENFIVEQYNVFQKFISLIDNKRIIIHCNNSYATTHFPDYFNSMVRCGFLLYNGIDGFNPVLNIATEIVNLNRVDGTIGYDRTVAVTDRLIGVIPIGYADGFDRKLSNNFKVLVNGEYASVVGNICMDMCMIDVTDIPNVKVGDKVTLLGSQMGKKITIYDYATSLKTSPYDVLLKFNSKRMDIITL